MMGEWVKELNILTEFARSEFKAKSVSIDGTKETGMAAILTSAVNGSKFGSITVHESPVSYLFDSRKTVGFYNLAIHIPGFLKWGDVSLASALTNVPVKFIHPLTMSGNQLTNEKMAEIKAEYETMKKAARSSAAITFE
jgi:hypothetical protein